MTNNKKFVVLDIDESKIGDIKYFTEMTKLIGNKDIRQAFYEDKMIGRRIVKLLQRILKLKSLKHSQLFISM